MWIARDKNGDLWLYKRKPIRNEKENDWIVSNPNEDAVGELDYTMFPELKWEDEPIEVNIVDVNKSIITDKDCIDEVYWREVRNNAAIAAMQSIIETCENISFTSIQEEVAETAIDCADILIEKLKSKDIKL